MRNIKIILRNLIIRGYFLLPILLAFSFNYHAFASSTLGTIDTTNKFAWGENIGWLNFGCDDCNVAITDTTITGYAWSSNFGWINLNPTNGGVLNDGEGHLSGNAWASNLGWINFTGVTIGSTGEFTGYATLDSDSSKINFNCATGASCASADFKVKTDWLPISARPAENGNSSSGSQGRANPPANPPLPPPANPPPFLGLGANISDAINRASDFLTYLFGGPKPFIEKNLVQVPKVAPISLNSTWNLLPEKAIQTFVFAPLPYEIRMLASKFPELNQTLKEVGVERFSDINKLAGVSLNIPDLADVLNKTIKTVGPAEIAELEKINGVPLGVPGLSNIETDLSQNIGTGKIALIEGLPVANFSPKAKKNLPAEFVFARAGGELVDLDVALSVGDKGEVSQKVSALPGQTLKLVVKPIAKADSVTGYIVFRAATPKISKNSILRDSLSASILFSMNGLVEKATTEDLNVEKKLVLSSFEYSDPDHDGIYTADVTTPVVPGEYEIVTVIAYKDPELGTRKMSMVTVIDPEGYVYEKQNGKETRIPSAIVSLYRLNTATKTYELWNAKDYQQENPQITDIRGTYSFLVPAGTYYFEVVAPGYKTFEGKAFVVSEGNGIHQNIEMRSSQNLLNTLDWQTILLIVVFLLLVYNLYRNNLRDKLNKLLKSNVRNQ